VRGLGRGITPGCGRLAIERLYAKTSAVGRYALKRIGVRLARRRTLRRFGMPYYRRLWRVGGTYFFTLVTYQRRSLFDQSAARLLLGDCIRECVRNRPFTIQAMVLLPDHLHLLCSFPEGDCDYATRIAVIKKTFTHRWLTSGGDDRPTSTSNQCHRRRGIWQRHYWEHTIRDQEDFNNHLNYIHYNPVKHGLATCPHAWPFSTFPKWVAHRGYDQNWCCCCVGIASIPPDFSGIEFTAE